MNAHLGELENLIERFYEAAVQPDLWRTVLHGASDVFGAEGAALLAWPYGPDGAVWSEGLDGIAETFFGEGWHTRNVRISRAMPIRHTKPVLTESDVFTPEELDRLPFNAEFINPHGFRWAAGGFIGPSSALTAFTFERKAKAGPFVPQEIRALETFYPHMRRAAEVAARLAGARDGGMLDAFEKMGCAAILFSFLGRVHLVNERARRYLGRGIQIQNGQLTACHKDANDSLQRLLASLLDPSKGDSSAQAFAVIPRPEGRALFACGMPIVRSATDIFGHSKAILILADPDENACPPEMILRQGFKLTPAEARLAMALAQGCKLDDYAARHAVRVGTVRSQLKAVMAKTSTHRQAELVSLLAQLAHILPRATG